MHNRGEIVLNILLLTVGILGVGFGINWFAAAGAFAFALYLKD